VTILVQPMKIAIYLEWSRRWSRKANDLSKEQRFHSTCSGPGPRCISI